MKSSNDQSFILVLLGILGVLGVRSIGGGTAQPTAAETSLTDNSAASASASDPKPLSFDAKLLELLGKTANHAQLKTVADFARVAPAPALTLIVTLPDPSISRMAWYFDQTVDAVTDAASTLGYGSDRYWLPWQTSGATGVSAPSCVRDTTTTVCAADNASLSVTTKPEAKPDSLKPSDAPGVLVYRRRSLDDRDGPAFLIVFLVGESPLSGLHRAAFGAALDNARLLSGHGIATGTASSPIVPWHPRILGPFFSSSAQSMRDELVHWENASASDTPWPLVISGSATSDNLDDQLGQVSTFLRTVTSDDQMRDFVHRRLAIERRFRRKVHIALLTEADTAYGAHTADPDQHTARPSAVHKLVVPVDGVDITAFRFPLHVAQLRAQRDGDTRATSDQRIANLRTTLALKLEPEAQERDDVPTFSTMSAFETELGLRDMLSDIARSDFDYMEIIATDPEDFIFLAQEAHKYASNVQLITYGAADRIFSHPDLMSDLSGLLVGASYPLISETQDWTSHLMSRKSFDSELAEGAYNGVLQLVSFDMGDTFAPTALKQLAERHLLDYSTPISGQLGPQMWLMSVANGRFWPLQTAPSLDAKFRQPSAGQRSDWTRPAMFADGLALVVTLLMLVHLGVLIWTRDGKHFEIPFVAMFVTPTSTTPDQVPLRAAWSSYVIGVLGALSVFTALEAYPSIWTLELRSSWQRVAGVIFALSAALCMIVVSLLLAARELMAFVARLRSNASKRPRMLPRWRESVGLLAFAAIVALYQASGALVWTLAQTSDWTARLLLLVRFSNPLGMCSLSALACLAAGFYVWGITGLMRVRRLDELPRLSISKAPSGASMLRLSSLIDSLHGDWRDKICLIELVGAALLAIPSGYFWFRMHPTFEPHGFDYLFRLSYVMLAAMVLFAVIHFSVLTQVLRELLRELAALPLVGAYDRIATKVTHSFGLQLDSRVPRPSELAISGEALHALTALAEQDNSAPLDVGAQLALRAACTPVDAAVGHVASSRAQLRDAHAALFEASSIVFDVLERAWTMRAADPQLGNVLKSVSTKELSPDGSLSKTPTVTVLAAATSEVRYVWMRLAEDFVAMRTATFISHVMGQIRLLMNFAITVALILVCAVALYPFQPERFIAVFTWSIVLIAVLASVATLTSLERDEVLSRLSRTQPGRVNLNVRVVSQLFVYALLPLLALVAYAVPSLGDYFVRWFGPVAGMLQ